MESEIVLAVFWHHKRYFLDKCFLFIYGKRCSLRETLPFFSRANYRFNVHGRWVRFHGSPRRWIKLFNSLERFAESQNLDGSFFRNTVTCRDRCCLRCDVCASGDVLINPRKNVCLFVTVWSHIYSNIRVLSTFNVCCTICICSTVCIEANYYVYWVRSCYHIKQYNYIVSEMRK